MECKLVWMSPDGTVVAEFVSPVQTSLEDWRRTVQSATQRAIELLKSRLAGASTIILSTQELFTETCRILKEEEHLEAAAGPTVFFQAPNILTESTFERFTPTQKIQFQHFAGSGMEQLTELLAGIQA